MVNLPAYIIVLLFLAYTAILIVLLISDDREPAITIAWLFILVFAPVIGVFFYILFGRDWKVVAQRKGWVTTLHGVRLAAMQPIYERNAAAEARFTAPWAGTVADKVARAIGAEDVTHVLPARTLDLFVNGADKFARLKTDLAEASASS